MRKQKVLDAAESFIEEGKKPSARAISEETGLPPQDVHRLLNALEEEQELESYTEDLFGRKVRRVSVKR